MFSLTLLVATVSCFIRHGAAAIECRDPAFSSNIFFDLAQLQLMAVQHREHIQTPTRCSAENGTSTCANQLCCVDEVDCCYRDRDSGRQNCGCKDSKDLECRRSAPLAVIRNYGCETHKRSEISMCFRRVLKGQVSEPSVSVHVGMSKDNGILEGAGNILAPAVDELAETIGISVLGENGYSGDDLIGDLTTHKLMTSLRVDVLNPLADQVAERRKKGLPYGRTMTSN